jgi:uncharacterized protein YrrD
VYRISDMIGKTVVSVSTGDRVGTVSDALLEPVGVRLMGLVVREGMLSKEHVLPLSDVQTVGHDALLIRPDEHLMDPQEWREAEITATRSSAVRGRRVLMAAGEEIGHLSDFLVHEKTGAFGGPEVESQSLGGLRSRRIVLRSSTSPRLGPDAIVVSEQGDRTAAGGDG